MAYTKYSLTPANNNAAPPDGAPEGMLPSAVNDTMRDMMAQIRDCGDGIRGGTYTMTAPVITGGSINGAAIGASSASTGAFTTLAYSSTLTGGTGVVNLGSGQFYKDSSGNIGLGTTSPSSYGKLVVIGTVVSGAVSSTSGSTLLSGNYGAGSLTNIGTMVSSGGPVLGYGATGSTSTEYEFLSTTNANLPRQAIYFDGVNFTFYSAAAQNTAIGSSITAMTEKMRLDGNGNLGIGTSSPSAKLTIAAAEGLRITNNASFISFWNSANTTRSGYLQINSSANAELMIQAANQSLIIGTNSSERMRIDADGKLLIGTTTAFGSGGLTLYKNGNGSGSSALIGFNSSSTDNYPIIFAYNGSNVGYIQYSNTTVLYVSLSDYRLKENIAPMVGALDIVSKLKPVTYKWKVDGSDGQGFIAHELAEVCPDAVNGSKDAIEIQSYEVSPSVPATFDEEGNELTPAIDAVMGEREVPKYQGIDTSFLVATLTAAIQEQQAMINELKAKVAALEAA